VLLYAGLINQQYSHIAAFALAAVLGAEIVLPPAAKRDSFAHYFSVFKEQVCRCQLLSSHCGEAALNRHRSGNRRTLAACVHGLRKVNTSTPTEGDSV